ncbi:hypothetical protein V2A60_000788 [Cordyceps javanica]
MGTPTLSAHQELRPESVHVGEELSSAAARRTLQYEQEEYPSVDHVLPSAEDGRYYCTYQGCAESFEIPSLLRKHVRDHAKPLKCFYYAECRFRSAQKREMERHMRVHVPDELKTTYKCKQNGCGKSYSRRDKLAEHEKKHH